MGAFGIGQPLSRFEDERLLRGGGTYVADRTLPRQAQACFLRSPHAHAAIDAIELKKWHFSNIKKFVEKLFQTKNETADMKQTEKTY